LTEQILRKHTKSGCKKYLSGANYGGYNCWEVGSVYDHTSGIEDSCYHNSCCDFSSLYHQAVVVRAYKVEESTWAVAHLASARKPSASRQAAPSSFLPVVEEVWRHHGTEAGIGSHNRRLVTRAGKRGSQGA